MQCIFVDEHSKYCWATGKHCWFIDAETKKTFCDTDNFDNCPRYVAYMELQKAKG